MTKKNYIDLEACAREGTSVTDAEGFLVRIDGEQIQIDEPNPTVQQLLKHANKELGKKQSLCVYLHGGGFEEIQLDKNVNLKRTGTKRFFCVDHATHHLLEIDGTSIEWKLKKITGLKLKELAGVDPDTFALWQEVSGKDDLQIHNEDLIDLCQDGVERFFTVIEKTTAGDVTSDKMLPSSDVEYLSEKNIAYKVSSSNGQTGIVLTDFALPDDYDAMTANILILLPTGYPDVAPDMFYCDPWLSLSTTKRFPEQANVEFMFNDIRWQRWSRHNHSWRPGIDGIRTMVRRIEFALHEAVK